MNDASFDPIETFPKVNITDLKAEIIERNQLSVVSRNQLSVRAPTSINEQTIRSFIEMQNSTRIEGAGPSHDVVHQINWHLFQQFLFDHQRLKESNLSVIQPHG